MDKYVGDYILKSDENFSLYEFLAENNKFDSWQIVAVFYSALCLAKAWLYNNGVAKNSVNSHDGIKFWLSNLKEAKNLNVLRYYEKLYFDSRDARYSIKKISKARIEHALTNYYKVKDLLQVR